MPNDQSLRAHYHLLLGLDKDWEVEEVKLSMEARAVHIRLRHRGVSAVIYPGCRSRCGIFDHAPERSGGIWTPCSLRPSCEPGCHAASASVAASKPSECHGPQALAIHLDVRGVQRRRAAKCGEHHRGMRAAAHRLGRSAAVHGTGRAER